MSITRAHFGTLPNGQEIDAYTLRSSTGLRARFINYGARLQSLILPDGHDCVLGFETLNAYREPHPYFGAMIGRYANRIKAARFTIEGQTFHVSPHEGPHGLHGGPQGFDRMIWAGALTPDRLTLSHTSPDQHQGYPGALKTVLTLMIDKNSLILHMRATTTAPTPVNLTHHSYFNLGQARTINTHELRINAPYITENTAEKLPTGHIIATAKSALDFQTEKKLLGQAIDDNFVMARPPSPSAKTPPQLKEMAVLRNISENGRNRSLSIYSTLPGLQVYTGDHIGRHIGKNGRIYTARAGIALEPQYYPDSPNHPQFPNTILRPDEIYDETIIYTFAY